MVVAWQASQRAYAATLLYVFFEMSGYIEHSKNTSSPRSDNPSREEQLECMQHKYSRLLLSDKTEAVPVNFQRTVLATRMGGIVGCDLQSERHSSSHLCDEFLPNRNVVCIQSARKCAVINRNFRQNREIDSIGIAPLNVRRDPILKNRL